MVEEDVDLNGSAHAVFNSEVGFGPPGAFIATSSIGGTEAEPGQISELGTWAVTAP
jgi:hypothetical protein